MHTVSRRAALAGLAFFALWPGPAGAQEQTLKIVFPFAAGSSTDAVARMLADHMQKSLGRAVIVENRPGAGGRIGLRAVKEAAPDGATLLFAPGGLFTILPHVYPNLGYDPLVDLLPITQVVRNDLALAVSGKLPVRSLPELVAWLKANPEQATFGSPGAGGAPHFLGVELGRLAKLGSAPCPLQGHTGCPSRSDDGPPSDAHLCGRRIHRAPQGRHHPYPGDGGCLALALPAGCPDPAGERLRHRGTGTGSRCTPRQARPRTLPNACERRSSTPCATPRSGPGSRPSGLKWRGRRVRNWPGFSAPTTSAGGRSSRPRASRPTNSKLAGRGARTAPG